MSQEKKEFKTSIGGQALIEGIYMRGPKKESVVVRTKEGLEVKVSDIKVNKERAAWLGWPFIRGMVNFGGSMVSGVKALMYSADFFMEDEEEESSKLEKWIEKKFGSEKLEQFIIYFSVILGMAFSVGLFILLPTLLAGLFTNIVTNYMARNLLEGAVRILLFLGYMVLVSKMKDMKRVFAYHGAEHKSIRCYEMRLPLTVENVKVQTRLHPRCGTSFLFVVMVVSILVFSVVSWSNPWIRMALRLALLPVVVGISYEINRFVGRHDNWFTRAVSFPGMWFQNFTTNEPDDDMMEVAITALEAVIPPEEGADKW
ncbi:MAG: DUF1385 domain-containing protein [Eubacteriales bacterium]